MTSPEVSAFLSSPILVVSPHADDAALSCGGLLLQHKDAKVVTIFDGDARLPRPQKLANLATPKQRREEDVDAMSHLGCEHLGLGIPDAIDRAFDGQRLYQSFTDLFGVVNRVDAELCGHIASEISEQLEGRTLLCPMAVGAHIDHQLCAHVGRRLQMAGHDVWFYPDAPYCFADPGPTVMADSALYASRRLQARIWSIEEIPIDPQSKAELVTYYKSQVVDLFGDLLTYEYLAEEHYHSLGGDVEIYHQLRW